MASRSEWAKRVERWQSSNLTAKEFAAKQGFNAGSLMNWKWVLGKEQQQAPAKRRSRTQRNHTSVSFTEVFETPAQKCSAIEVVLGERLSVRVVEPFDSAVLAQVLDVVEGRR